MPAKMNREAIEITKQRLLYMHCEYRHYMNCDAREIPSTGMVQGYSQVVSGRTNRTCDFTAMHGMSLANIPLDKLESLRWIDCAWRVFQRGTSYALSKEKPKLNVRRNRAAVAYVLYYKAFLGYTFERIAGMGLPSGAKVSRQRIHDYWELAVQEVAEEARKEGLI